MTQQDEKLQKLIAELLELYGKGYLPWDSYVINKQKEIIDRQRELTHEGEVVEQNHD